MRTSFEIVTTSSILTKGDVAHLVGLPRDTVQRWSRSPASGRLPLITQSRQGYGPNPPTIPLLGLSEASLMKHLKDDRKIGPRKISSAVRSAKEQDPYIFGHGGFYTDGTDVFIKLLDGTERVKDQQRAIEGVLKQFAKRINFGSDGLMQSFVVREMNNDRVIIDPRRSSGRPFLEESGMPVFPILAEIRGKTPLEAIAEEFDVTLEAVRDVRSHRGYLAAVA